MAEIPVLLLKTRTVPDDGYEEYFSTRQTEDVATIAFKPIFVPVLEHTPNTPNLEKLERLLRRRDLKRKYGGMIFTSQRAVEGWRGVVERVESDLRNDAIDLQHTAKGTLSNPTTERDTLDYSSLDLPLQDSDIPFPLYVVGPATESSLSSLLKSSKSLVGSTDNSSTSSRSITTNINNTAANEISSSTTQSFNNHPPSPFTALNPRIRGAHTGSGAALAPFILSHYNTLHSHRIFTFWEAPRLPFIPLVGPGPSPSKTADGTVRRGGMVRLERDDRRLTKNPLLFLVGETRRDVIPKTLMDGGLGEGRVRVEEVEVYSTQERGSFGVEFGGVLESLEDEGKEKAIVVVVFSPQGCESMLHGVGFLDDEGKITERAKRRWQESTQDLEATSGVQEQDGGDADGGPKEMRYVIATIGPTTRDYLRKQFGFDPDICAKKPSPEGVGEGIRAFLREKGFV